MLIKQSKVNLIDNCGGIIGNCIHIYGKKTVARVGDLVLLSIIRTITGSKIKKGEIYKAIIVRSKAEGGSSNAAVLVKIVPKTIEYNPIGTRILGPISEKLRYKKGNNKILSIAKLII